jgi:site-specific DNA-cytosine methylase
MRVVHERIINLSYQELYRKLTPLECERLQTVPDNYTNYVSNTQRYKMLGNGWTVDMIAHIMKGIKDD